jgi:RimJ/RimL family protein N-acetyltransferase
MDITLRPARPADADEMAPWFVDLTDLATWGGPEVRFPLTAEQMAAWIAEGANPTPRLCFTAIDDVAQPVGHVEFLHDPAKRWARLGRFAVAPALRGRGFGRALFDRAVDYAFSELDVEHLALAVMPENERARRLYLSSGFRDEGAMPGEWTVAGKPYVMNVMGLIRSDWLRRTTSPTDAVKVA